MKKFEEYNKVDENLNTPGKMGKQGYILHKDGWVFNDHFLDRAPRGGTLWPAMKRLEHMTQEDYMDFEFFIDEEEHGNYYEKSMAAKKYNPDAIYQGKPEPKTMATFTSDEDVYGGNLGAKNEEEAARYRKHRGTHVVFLTKSNGKSAALKKKYLSQYNDLGGFEVIPAYIGLVIDWDKKK